MLCPPAGEHWRPLRPLRRTPGEEKVCIQHRDFEDDAGVEGEGDAAVPQSLGIPG